MEKMIFLEENGEYQFDFSGAESAWEIHEICNKISLSDVDFIARTKGEMLFIEYKNANIKGAINPDALAKKLGADKTINKLVKKYYDSVLTFWALEGKNELPMKYVFLVEGPNIDSRVRRSIKQRLMNIMAFKLEDKDKSRRFISELEVYDLKEFRHNIPEVKVEKVEKEDSV